MKKKSYGPLVLMTELGPIGVNFFKFQNFSFIQFSFDVPMEMHKYIDEDW